MGIFNYNDLANTPKLFSVFSVDSVDSVVPWAHRQNPSTSKMTKHTPGERGVPKDDKNHPFHS